MNHLANTMLLLCMAVSSVLGTGADALDSLRPPAVPLITIDPYFSVWSSADRLTDDVTRHWTGSPQPMTSLVQIDGKTYRLMGLEPKDTPAFPQAGVQVLPTQTIYDFENSKVHITLTFMTPALPDDLDILARPVTYLTWEVRSRDHTEHKAALYFDQSANIAVNTPDQRVTWHREKFGSLSAIRIGTEEQPLLQKRGDDLRIDWGYAYVAANSNQSKSVLAEQNTARNFFIQNGGLPLTDGAPLAGRADDKTVSAFVFDLGEVSSAPISRTLILAYDDIYSITYFRQKLRPYWRRKGAEASDLLKSAARDYTKLARRCKAFDTELMADMEKAGGKKYAQLSALAYRQCLAANMLAADSNGQPLLFPKENFSNGCISTVDVIYPMNPFFLLLSPTLAKASLVPILSYASSSRWKFPFAPHDLGTYPVANGQVYGGGERTEDDQMPVEESGNMILLLAAIAREEGNADFASQYWPQVKRWAEFLEAKGFDPENQLCTDDFAGHLAHNVNLSAKAIEALGGYSLLCGMRGEKQEAERVHAMAVVLAKKWIQAADDGDHFRLAFDREGTWSQKYNLVWDRILELKLFPAKAAQKEMEFYRKHLNEFGLPLDNRESYTKLDWTIWTATLTGNPEDFAALVDPVYNFLNTTSDRVAMTDWYQTKDAKKVGFQARPVVGGVYIKMLADAAIWKKWSKRDKHTVGNWSALPLPPTVTDVIPTSQKEPSTWRYTFVKPADNWFTSLFNDLLWNEGNAGFGTEGTPGGVIRTEWKSDDIWIRREFTLPSGHFSNLQFWVHHDEDVEIYINGVLAGQASGFTADYDSLPITPAGLAALKSGKNLIAAHCHQTTGGQYIDIGIVNIREVSR